MSTRSDRAIVALAVHEGGWSNHPKDPGGATMKGVTQRTYDAYNTRIGKTTRSVRHITDEEVTTIYQEQYWNTISGDALPNGLGYCVFDGSVNSGPSRAAKWLQQVLKVAQDGVIGAQTLAALVGRDIKEIIDLYCDLRLAFMKRLKHWSTFKNGWTRRVSEVRKQSKKWADGFEVKPSVVAMQPKADGPESISAVVKDMLTDKGAMGGVAGVLGATGTLLGGDGPVQYALAAVLVMGAVTGIWWMVRGRHT